MKYLIIFILLLSIIGCKEETENLKIIDDTITVPININGTELKVSKALIIHSDKVDYLNPNFNAHYSNRLYLYLSDATLIEPSLSYPYYYFDAKDENIEIYFELVNTGSITGDYNYINISSEGNSNLWKDYNSLRGSLKLSNSSIVFFDSGNINFKEILKGEDYEITFDIELEDGSKLKGTYDLGFVYQ